MLKQTELEKCQRRDLCTVWDDQKTNYIADVLHPRADGSGFDPFLSPNDLEQAFKAANVCDRTLSARDDRPRAIRWEAFVALKADDETPQGSMGVAFHFSPLVASTLALYRARVNDPYGEQFLDLEPYLEVEK